MTAMSLLEKSHLESGDQLLCTINRAMIQLKSAIRYAAEPHTSLNLIILQSSAIEQVQHKRILQGG